MPCHARAGRRRCATQHVKVTISFLIEKGSQSRMHTKLFASHQLYRFADHNGTMWISPSLQVAVERVREKCERTEACLVPVKQHPRFLG